MSTLAKLEQFESRVNALIERHDGTRSLADLTAYKGRPLDFMRDELKFTPYDKQREIIASFETNRRTAVPGAHGVGKDALLGPLMLYAAYACGMLVLAISSTEKQLLGQLWGELAKRFTVGRLPGELYTADLRIAGRNASSR